MDIEKILNDAGLETVTGYDAVKQAIQDEAGPGEPTPLCSGFRVFPDGSLCYGCEDCNDLLGSGSR